MSATSALLRVYVRAARAGWREPRVRAVRLLLAILAAAGGVWGARSLTGAVNAWREAGAAASRGGHVGPPLLDVRLWQLLFAIWVGTALLAALGTLTRELTGDEALLLLTLPLPDAACFRALFLADLVVTSSVRALMLSCVLLGALGWAGARWLAVALAGVATASLLGITGVLALVRLLPRLSGRGWVALGGGALLILGGVTELAARSAARVAPPAPLPTALALALPPLLALGPAAGQLGRLYVAACREARGSTRRRRPRGLPGASAVASLLGRVRTPLGGMLVKGVLYQGRDPLVWAHLGVLAAFLALSPLLVARLSDLGTPPLPLAVGLAWAAVLLTAAETASSPLGGEGGRAALWLASPLDLGALLRHRVAVCVLPLAIEALLVACVVGLQLGLRGAELMHALALAPVAVVVAGNLLVCGSAWDLDLRLVVEGAMPVLLHEHAPVGPIRVLLLGASAALLAVSGLVVWLVPAPASFVALLALHAGVVAVSWQLGMRGLRRARGG